VFKVYVNGNYVSYAQTINEANAIVTFYTDKFLKGEIVRKVEYVYDAG